MIQSVSFLLLLTAFLAGCSSTPETEPEEKTYSEETNRAFELIERGYNAPPLKKAPAPNPAPQIGEPPSSDAVTSRTTKKSFERPSIPTAKAGRSGKKSEKLIELNQNLAFYCMKHRNNPVFKNDEKKCMDHVNRVLADCQKRTPDVHAMLLSCVKKRLGKI